MQKLITKIVWTQFGVRQFQHEVNDNLKFGWKVCNLSIEKRGLRFVCYCLLIDKVSEKCDSSNG